MKIDLLLGVHAHQPVGNFDEVMVEAHERCYKPFLETLYRYPAFRFSAHFSGWLLSWLIERFPDDMALLREMVARGQVEMFGSGDCEPVLAAISTRDRVTQIETLSRKLQRDFVRPPTGAWLTERVWESSVVGSLADTGIRYVAVDDYHFLCTGLPAEALDGHYTTEEDGRRLDLFPISEALRYRIPFAPASEVVAYLEGLAAAGHRGAVYFDDIEKFGIWPETYDWVYGRGWLEQFITGVLGSESIRTSTYADFHAATPTRGVVYLPTTSYIEMNEWTLPAPAAETYAQLIDRERHAGRFDQAKPFLRGGIWRNFLSRYPESNWMHKRVQTASERLARVPAAPAELTELLHRAQANDAYWHGLFGGLYLPHLRRAVWNNLLELEAALDRLAPRPGLFRADVDLDGNEELFLHSGTLQIAMRLDGDGAIHEISSYPLRQNFGDTLRRRREHYHKRIEQNEQSSHAGEGIRSAHDRIEFKHPIGESDLEVDQRPRSSFLDSWQAAGAPAPRALDDYALVGVDGQRRQASLRVVQGDLLCAKTVQVEADRLTVRYDCSGSAGTMETSLNIAMPSCDGYAGRYMLADGSIPCGFGQLLLLDEAKGLTLDDRWMAGGVRIETSRPVAIRAAPFHTVSLSEAGFEKIMQGVALHLRWPVDAAGTRTDIAMSLYRDD